MDLTIGKNGSYLLTPYVERTVPPPGEPTRVTVAPPIKPDSPLHDTPVAPVRAPAELDPLKQPEPTKVCSRCKVAYPRTIQYFYRDRVRKDGLFTYCRNCAKDVGRTRNRIKKGIPLDKPYGVYQGAYPVTDEERKQHQIDLDRMRRGTPSFVMDGLSTPKPGQRQCTCGRIFTDDPVHFPTGKDCYVCENEERVPRKGRGRPRKEGVYVTDASQCATPELPEEELLRLRQEIQGY